MTGSQKCHVSCGWWHVYINPLALVNSFSTHTAWWCHGRVTYPWKQRCPGLVIGSQRLYGDEWARTGGTRLTQWGGMYPTHLEDELVLPLTFRWDISTHCAPVTEEHLADRQRPFFLKNELTQVYLNLLLNECCNCCKFTSLPVGKVLMWHIPNSTLCVTEGHFSLKHKVEHQNKHEITLVMQAQQLCINEQA